MRLKSSLNTILFGRDNPHARQGPRWLEVLTTVCLLGSVPLAVAFARDGKTGSFLVQIAITMSLLSSKFDFNGRLSRRTEAWAKWLMWAWLGVELLLVLASLLLLVLASHRFIP